jgi:hypothetical protein
MQKMKPEYAQQLLDGGYAFGNRFHSCHDNLLVVSVEEDYYPYRDYYAGTELKDGQLQVDDEGYVRFSRVEPIIDENTKFSL